MSLMRVMFAAEIKKSETKQVGGKTLVEFSVCKKNKTKDGEEAHYTWLKIQCWEAPEWLAAKLIKGAFVAGSGDMTMRSFDKQDGTKGVSVDVRCSSYDLELPYTGDKADTRTAQPITATHRAPPKVHDHMSKPAQGASKAWEKGNDEPPFAPLGEWG